MDENKGMNDNELLSFDEFLLTIAVSAFALTPQQIGAIENATFNLDAAERRERAYRDLLALPRTFEAGLDVEAVKEAADFQKSIHEIEATEMTPLLFSLTSQQLESLENGPMNARAAWMHNMEQVARSIPGIPIISASPLPTTTNEATEAWHGLGAATFTTTTTQSSGTLTVTDLEALFDQVRNEPPPGAPYFVVSPYVAEHWDEWEHRSLAQWHRDRQKQRSEERKARRLRLRIRRKRRAIARRRRKGLA